MLTYVTNRETCEISPIHHVFTCLREQKESLKRVQKMAPGLQRLDLGQRPPRPPKGDAGEGLRAQTPATGAATRGNVGATGKLNQNTTMSFFGKLAIRENHLIGNVKAGYSQGISNIRHSFLDARGGGIFMMPPPLRPREKDNNNAYMDNYTKMMELQMLQKSIGDFTAGGIALAKVLKSDGKGSTTKTTDKTTTTTTTTGKAQEQQKTDTAGQVTQDIQTVLDTMSNATDSKTLEPALNDAKSKLQGCISDKSALEGEKAGLVREKARLEQNVQEAQEGVKAKQKEIADKQKEIEKTQKKIENNEQKIEKLDPVKDKDEIEKLQKENSRLSAAKTNLEMQLSEMRLDSGRLVNIVNAEQAKVDAKQGEIDTVSTQIKNQEANIESLQTNIPKFEAKLTEFKAKEAAEAAKNNGPQLV